MPSDHNYVPLCQAGGWSKVDGLTGWNNPLNYLPRNHLYIQSAVSEMQFTFTHHVSRLRFFSFSLVFLFLLFKLLGLDQISTSSVAFNAFFCFSHKSFRFKLQSWCKNCRFSGIKMRKQRSAELQGKTFINVLETTYTLMKITL